MFHDVYQAVCSKRRSRARPSHRHPPEGDGAGQEGSIGGGNRRWMSEHQQTGLMGVWIHGSGDGCVSGFSSNWRCECVAAVHIMSEKRRDSLLQQRNQISTDGFYWLEWRDSMADGQMQGQRMKGCMHDQLALFQGDSQRVGEVDSGSLWGHVDSGGVIRRVKS